MKINFKKIKLLMVGGFLAGLFFLTPLFTQAADDPAKSYDFISGSGLEKTGTAVGYTENLKSWTPENIFSNALFQILSWLGVIFLILIIYGGVLWMTAEGNEEKAGRARRVIIGAVSGLVIVIAAYAISYYLISFFSEQTLN